MNPDTGVFRVAQGQEGIYQVVFVLIYSKGKVCLRKLGHIKEGKNKLEKLSYKTRV